MESDDDDFTPTMNSSHLQSLFRNLDVDHPANYNSHLFFVPPKQPKSNSQNTQLPSTDILQPNITNNLNLIPNDEITPHISFLSEEPNLHSKPKSSKKESLKKDKHKSKDNSIKQKKKKIKEQIEDNGLDTKPEKLPKEENKNLIKITEVTEIVDNAKEENKNLIKTEVIEIVNNAKEENKTNTEDTLNQNTENVNIAKVEKNITNKKIENARLIAESLESKFKAQNTDNVKDEEKELSNKCLNSFNKEYDLKAMHESNLEFQKLTLLKLDALTNSLNQVMQKSNSVEETMSKRLENVESFLKSTLIEKLQSFPIVKDDSNQAKEDLPNDDNHDETMEKAILNEKPQISDPVESTNQSLPNNDAIIKPSDSEIILLQQRIMELEDELKNLQFNSNKNDKEKELQKHFHRQIKGAMSNLYGNVVDVFEVTELPGCDEIVKKVNEEFKKTTYQILDIAKDYSSNNQQLQ